MLKTIMVVILALTSTAAVSREYIKNTKGETVARTYKTETGRTIIEDRTGNRIGVIEKERETVQDRLDKLRQDEADRQPD